MPPLAIEERIRRFWKRVDKSGDCWLWMGSHYPSGYGVARDILTGKQGYAHRVAFKLLVGDIPKELQIDHLCRVRNCVNPTHMELVTPKVNTLRGNSMSAIHAVKTHCPAGHLYDEINTYLDSDGSRHCRMCGMLNARRYRKAAGAKSRTP